MDATSTPTTTSTPTSTGPADSDAPGNPVDELVEDELLVEEISIDGMCGVY
ncbi:MAG: mycofactocin precursor MftA [Ilumatobacteraceae bacterium]